MFPDALCTAPELSAIHIIGFVEREARQDYTWPYKNDPFLILFLKPEDSFSVPEQNP